MTTVLPLNVYLNPAYRHPLHGAGPETPDLVRFGGGGGYAGPKENVNILLRQRMLTRAPCLLNDLGQASRWVRLSTNSVTVCAESLYILCRMPCVQCVPPHVE